MIDMVVVTYHQEPEGLWAEVDALPTFSAAAADFNELRTQVRTALGNLLGADVDLREDVTELGWHAPVVIHRIHDFSPQWRAVAADYSSDVKGIPA